MWRKVRFFGHFTTWFVIHGYRFHNFIILIRSIFILILLAFSGLDANGGNGLSGKTGRGMAIGFNSNALIDAFSISHNQAAAAFCEQPSIGLSYASSFMPLGISRIGASGSVPVPVGVVGGTMEYFGEEHYSELLAGLAYALRIGEKVGIGIQLDYLTMAATGGRRRHFATFEVGLLFQPIDNLAIGVHVFNPVKWTVSKTTGELLPIVLEAGLCYRLAASVSLYAGVEKDMERPFSFSGGMEWNPGHGLAVRTGWANAPHRYTFGAGYRLRDRLQMDVASAWHSTLGFQTAISISINFGQNREHGGDGEE